MKIFMSLLLLLFGSWPMDLAKVGRRMNCFDDETAEGHVRKCHKKRKNIS